MGLLDAAGYVFVDSLDEADLCLINSCTVKSPSEFALYSVIQQALQIEVPTASAVRAGHRACSEVSPVIPASASPHVGSKESSSPSSLAAPSAGPLSPIPAVLPSPHHTSPNTAPDSPTSTPAQSSTPLSEKTTEASECGGGGGERDQRDPLGTLASLGEDNSGPSLLPSHEKRRVEKDFPDGVSAEARNKQQKKATKGERKHDEDKREKSSHLVGEKEECQVSTVFSCGESCCCSSSPSVVCRSPSPRRGSKHSEEGGGEDEEAGGENKKSSEEHGCGGADKEGSSCCCSSSPCCTGVSNSSSACGEPIKQRHGKEKKGLREEERMKEGKKVSIVLKQRRTKPIPCVVAGCVPHAAGESSTSEKRSKKNVVLSGGNKTVEELHADGDVNKEGEAREEEEKKRGKKVAGKGSLKRMKGEVEKKGGETSEQRDLLRRCSIVGVHAIDRIVEVVEEALKGNVVRLTGKRK